MSEMTVTSVSHGPFDGSLDRERIAAYAPVSYTHLTLPTIYSV